MTVPYRARVARSEAKKGKIDDGWGPKNQTQLCLDREVPFSERSVARLSCAVCRRVRIWKVSHNINGFFLINLCDSSVFSLRGNPIIIHQGGRLLVSKTDLGPASFQTSQ